MRAEPSSPQERLRERRRRRSEGGMTLIEISVAIAILGMMVGLVYTMIAQAIKGRDMIKEGLQEPKMANAILAQILKDFRYLSFPPLKGETGFFGQNRTENGKDADRVDFITARDTRTVGSEDDGARTSDDRRSPLSEVGYACRVSETNPEYIELWRREDYYVDSDPVNGGRYSLLYDRIRRFSLRFFPSSEEQAREEEGNAGLEDWDSRTRHKVPYAIILEIEMDVVVSLDKGVEETEPYRITRIILLRPGAGDSVRWSTEELPENP